MEGFTDGDAIAMKDQNQTPIAIVTDLSASSKASTNEEDLSDENKITIISPSDFPEVFPYLDSHVMRPPSPPRDEHGRELVVTEDHTLHDWLEKERKHLELRWHANQESYARSAELEKSWEGRTFLPLGKFFFLGFDSFPK